MAETPQTSIRLGPELRAALKRLAEADRRPLSAYIINVLEDHVAAQQGRDGQTSRRT